VSEFAMSAIERFESLEGWQIVDAAGGRRWIGRVIEAGPSADPRDMGDLSTASDELKVLFLATSPEWIKLWPAFEILPTQRALLTVPVQQAVSTNGRRAGTMPTWTMGPSLDMIGVLMLPWLPPVTLQRVGFVRIDDMADDVRAHLLTAVNAAIDGISLARKSAERARGLLEETKARS
jgi:hypothetical protein